MRLTFMTLLRLLLVVLSAAILATLSPGRLPIRPDLVLLVVVAGALVRGPVTGALIGLLAGWVVDLMPPGGVPLGAAGFLYAAAGAAAGGLRSRMAWSAPAPVLALAVAALLMLAARWVAAASIGTWLDLRTGLLSVGFTCVLGMVAVPLLMRLECHLVTRRLA